VTATVAPSGLEWLQERELLARILDRLGEAEAIAASHPLSRSVKPKTAPPHCPRPTQALDVARARRRSRQLAELDAEVEAAKAWWRAQCLETFAVQ
jgi:hypothetical protein